MTTRMAYIFCLPHFNSSYLLRERGKEGGEKGEEGRPAGKRYFLNTGHPLFLSFFSTVQKKKKRVTSGDPALYCGFIIFVGKKRGGGRKRERGRMSRRKIERSSGSWLSRIS